jgi:hypothetical protein
VDIEGSLLGSFLRVRIIAQRKQKHSSREIHGGVHNRPTSFFYWTTENFIFLEFGAVFYTDMKDKHKNMKKSNLKRL